MASVQQVFDDDPPHLDQYQRDAWLQLQSSLARTLDDLYLVCEGDTQSELVLSTLRILEETVDDFRLLATTTTTSPVSSSGFGSQHAFSTSTGSSSPAGTVACSCLACHGAKAMSPADAAAVISRSTGSCCSTWCTDAPCSSSGCASSCSSGVIAKPPGSSRLSRSSSAGCNLGLLASSHSRADALSYSGPSVAGCIDAPSSTTGIAGDAQAGCSQDELHSCTVSDTLHQKLSSPERLRRSPSQTKAASEERHAKAERLREQLAEARLARLQEQLVKQQRRAAASKGQERSASSSSASSSSSTTAVRAADKHQRSSLLRAAHLRRIRAKAEDESRKVDEVSFINNLTTAGKKADLQQRLEEGEARRAEALAAILAKQQEAAANVREAAERRRAAEAERLAQLEHRQRRKEEMQAKMEQERRAAVAAREAARAQARALAQQREAARQQQASQLRDKVNARLKQAAERRLQHLELIRERAALGKDFDRRDSFAGGPSSGRQSPVSVVSGSKATLPYRPARSPVPTEGSGPTASSSSSSFSRAELDEAGADGGMRPSKAHMAKLSVQAAAFCPSGTTGSLCTESSQVSVSQASVSQASTVAGSTSVPQTGLLPCDVFGQLQGNSQSIAASGLSAAPSSVKASMKGNRRRMARAKHRMQQPGCCFQEPEFAQQLSQSAEWQQLFAAWAPHLAVLQIQQPGQDATAASTAGDTGADSTGPASVSSTSSAGQPAEQACVSTAAAAACDSSSKSSSATNSPRSSTSSYAGVSVSTSTFSSTVVGSPAGCCPANWVLSRSSSCCDCDSQHSAGVAAAAPCSRSKLAAAEQQREALAALVTSARSHLGKQQVMVSHLARHTGLLHRLCEEVLAACSGGGSSSGSNGACDDAASAEARRQERLQQARLLELLGRLLELPANLDYLLSCGQLLPAFVRSTRIALDHCNSLEADEPSMMRGGEAASRLSMLLQVLVAVLEHTPGSADLVSVQEQLVGFTVAAGMVARLAGVFSLFDQPMQQAARPVPPHVLQCLRLLGGLTAVRSPPDELLPGRLWPSVAPNAAAILLEMQATSMAGVLSLLTAVLLNASPTCTPAEASSRALPPNFVEAAHLVMSVLNNVCRLDLLAGQYMLSCAHHRMEFHHLISFLLSYCLSRWPAPVMQHAAAAAAAVAPSATVVTPRGSAECVQAEQQQQQQAAESQPQQQQQPTHPQPEQQSQTGANPVSGANGTSSSSSSSPGGKAEQTGRPPGVAAVVHHPIAALLNQVLLLIGYFCVQHPSNQAMLTWGRSPSILQRLCSLPQEYLQVPELRAVLMPTLLCVCYGAERTCEMVAQHFDLGVLLQYMQQQGQGVVQQQQQTHQQKAASATRHERRRQRRTHHKQQQQAQQQQHDSCQQDQEQQAPTGVQQMLQQVNTTCCGSMQSSSSTSEQQGCDGSSRRSSSDGTTSGRGTGCAGCRSAHPGRSRHVAFALSRRFPQQLLPVAQEQLQGVQRQQHTAAASGCVEQPHTEPRCNPCGVHQHQEDQQQQADQQQPQQTPAAGTSDEAQQPGNGDTAPALQLPLQRNTATKLVRCEVVACS